MSGVAQGLILLAAGGTGGHVFPAESLAAELVRRGYRLALVTDSRGQAYGGTLGSIVTYRIRAGGLAGRSVLGLLRGVAKLAVGAVEAYALLHRLRPVVVVGFGGYAAAPPVAAAIASHIPTVIHEQNAVLGRANRLLAPRVSQIATSFETVDAMPAKAHAAYTGMPVRPAVLAVRDTAYPTLDGPIRIVVLGGSQGAHIFSDVIPAALKLLPPALAARLEVSQQCRPEDLEAATQAYARTGIRADLKSFFHDVPERLAAAHLVIARAGASTVSELTAVGRPAILIPYPYATDAHQAANARAVAETGGAWLIPQESFTPEVLGARLTALFETPATLQKAAACARAAGHPDAAARLADIVVELGFPGSSSLPRPDPLKEVA